MGRLSFKHIATAMLSFSLIATVRPQDADEPGPDQAHTIERGTVVLLSERPQIGPADTEAHFTIDVSHMRLKEKLRLLSAKRAALVFDPSNRATNRLCPFFNLESRAYTIREIRRDVFRLTTPITAAEGQQITAADCAVTTTPDRKKIEYLPS